MPRELFVLDSSLGFSYDVLPDGEGFLHTSSGETGPGAGQTLANEFLVTLNFFEELKQLAPRERSKK